jgi:tetratricopeptide (TPR) repeat protein
VWLARTQPVDAEAHLSYVRARYYFAKRTSEGLQKALGCFEQAVAQDPAYAAAWAGIADTYCLLAAIGYDVLPARAAVPKAKAAALKALELDDSLAEAHASLGQVLKDHEWDFPAAERSYQKALALDPEYATAHHWYSNFLSAVGRLDEALAEARRALELEPLSLVINQLVARPHYFARRYEEALEASRRTLEMEPGFALSYLQLGLVHTAMGASGAAVEALRRFLELTGGSTLAVGLLGLAHGRAGDRREALKLLDELQQVARRGYVPSYHFAAVHIGLGDADEAFAWLGRAYEERSDVLVYLGVEPAFDPIRGDARFQDLVRRVGLPGEG